MPKQKGLDTAPYKGVRDFYPEDQAIQAYIFKIWRKTVESFGYEEYNASPLEYTELYNAKSGEEIVGEQTYTFEDRGGRSVTLRPEMTPTVARMVAAQERELPFPLRWYSIPNVFRYEKPQRGRLREHYQLNVDLFGSDALDSEIEMITLAHTILKNFGANDTDFTIRINNRKILSAIFEKLSITDEESHKLSKLIDKKEKISQTVFEESMTEIIGERAVPLMQNLSSNQALIQTLGEKHPEIVSLIDLIEALDTAGIKNVQFTSTLMRGFDYYTGLVFEIFDTSEKNNRSLFGGGRFDELLDIFGKRTIPTIGFGMGDVTLRDFLETHDLLPAYQSSTQVYVCLPGDETREYGRALAESLREVGLTTALDLTGKNKGDQYKLAHKKNIPFAVYVDPKKANQNLVIIRNLETREETELPDSKVARFIFDALSK